MKIKINLILTILIILGISCDKKNEDSNHEILYGSVTDIDGNNYKTIEIGNQIWMAENLKVTKFNDSTPITYQNNNLSWNRDTTAAYCNYNGATTSNEYGSLYNWYAVNTGNLCPKGFHVSSESDWEELNLYLNDSMAALKLKETGWDHWAYAVNSATATNSSNFTALPGGERTVLGLYDSQGLYGWWWSSTETTIHGAKAIKMNYIDSALIFESLSKTYGFSVRCVKD
jgi:uncharacterized protein (TIGR02145 family)